MFKLRFTNTWNRFENSVICTWDVVKFIITHQEGHIAKASLLVGCFTPPQGSYLAIFENDELIFQGMLSGQFEHTQYLTKIDILCLCPTFDADLKSLITTHPLPYNPLFFQDTPKKSSDYLEATNLLFYWHKCSGKVSLSNYFKGSRRVNLGGQYIAKSFKMQQINMPLGKVTIDLKVEWTQTLEGLFDAAPYIARAFPEKIITSLTPEGLINHWPVNDQSLGQGTRQSGYRVEYSKITPITDNPTLPTYTKPIAHKHKDHLKTIRAKIHSFKTCLKIRWHYHQPRAEHLLLHAALNHSQHRFTQHKIRHIPISVHLLPSQKAMFFETTQGQQVIAYAKRIAQSQLFASARCMQVTFSLPWNLGKDLTLDDSLTLKSPTQEQITGKIIKLRFVVKAGQKHTEVTLGCSITPGDLQNTQTPNPSESYGDEPWDDLIHSSDPLMGIVTETLNPRDFIEQIIVKNSASTQEAYLLQNQYPVRDNMAEVLKQVPTTIHLTMCDLRTKKPLLRRFTIALPPVLPVL